MGENNCMNCIKKRNSTYHVKDEYCKFKPSDKNNCTYCGADSWVASRGIDFCLQCKRHPPSDNEPNLCHDCGGNMINSNGECIDCLADMTGKRSDNEPKIQCTLCKEWVKDDHVFICIPCSEKLIKPSDSEPTTCEKCTEHLCAGCHEKRLKRERSNNEPLHADSDSACKKSLSDYIIFGGLADGGMDDDHAVIQRRKVKEFIKELKTFEYSKTMGGSETDHILISFDDLDKLVGPKLTETEGSK